jgi:hypothetical protein
VSSSTRLGVQIGVDQAFSNQTPSLASLSMLGVR